MSRTPQPVLWGLFAAAALFLWMFLAAAPLETLADRGAFGESTQAEAAVEAYRFAADWRHGMTGNSPLYMPGFFALAIAAWFWSSSRSVQRLALEGTCVLVAGVAVAWLCADVAKPFVVEAFERSTGFDVSGPWPNPPWRSVVQGLYTAVTWITTVVACCRALARRSFMPLLVVPPMAVALALIRPWTVDDFVALWITHAMRGDVTALVSVIAIPVVGWTMVRSERGAQRVQNHLRLSRMDVDE